MTVEIAAIVDRMQAAGHAWESALDAHALAPPDAGFPGRLSALSNAAADQAKAFGLAAEGGLGWRSRTVDGNFSLAPELTRGMNRPGPDDLWAQFDAAVAGLARALAGSSVAVLVTAFTQLSEVSAGLAAEVQPLYRAGRLAM